MTWQQRSAINCILQNYLLNYESKKKHTGEHTTGKTALKELFFWDASLKETHLFHKSYRYTQQACICSVFLKCQANKEGSLTEKNEWDKLVVKIIERKVTCLVFKPCGTGTRVIHNYRDAQREDTNKAVSSTWIKCTTEHVLKSHPQSYPTTDIKILSSCSTILRWKFKQRTLECKYLNLSYTNSTWIWKRLTDKKKRGRNILFCQFKNKVEILSIKSRWRRIWGEWIVHMAACPFKVPCVDEAVKLYYRTGFNIKKFFFF